MNGYPDRNLEGKKIRLPWNKNDRIRQKQITTALQVCKWCAALGPMGRGGHPSLKLLTDCTCRHNYYRQTSSFYYNGPIINNIFLWSFARVYSKVLSKCRKFHFRDPKFKNVLAENPPGPPYKSLHMSSLCGAGKNLFAKSYKYKPATYGLALI